MGAYILNINLVHQESILEVQDRGCEYYNVLSLLSFAYTSFKDPLGSYLEV